MLTMADSATTNKSTALTNEIDPTPLTASSSQRSTIQVDFQPNTLPECIEVPPRKEHKATVFFVHGLGDNAKNFSRFISTFSKFKDHPSMDHVKIIFPDAPIAPLTANKGYLMHTWFDVVSFDSIKRREDKPSLSLAVSRLSALVAQEHSTHNVPFEKILIGGLSQGGALSVLTRLTTLQGNIGGVFVLSSYLPLREEIFSKEILGSHTTKLPIFWGHGTTDPQVPHGYWKSIAEQLATTIEIPFIDSEGDRNEVRLTKEEVERDGLGSLRFVSYPDLGHWLSEEALDDLNVWIGAVLESE